MYSMYCFILFHIHVICVGPRGKTKRQYTSAKRHWLPKFLKSAGWEQQYPTLNEDSLFLKEVSPGKWEPNRNTYTRFASYLFAERVRAPTFKVCMAFMWNELNSHLLRKNLPKVEEGYILDMPGIRECHDQTILRDRTSGMVNCEDIQADIDVAISTEKKIEMFNLLWRLELPSDGKHTGGCEFTSPLYQYNTLYEFAITHASQVCLVSFE